MTYDAIIIGGGFAGMSAAMQLARARRRILLVDAGQPRNRFAKAAHGFFGHDGAPPAALSRRALAQLSAYPTVDFHHGAAVSAGGEVDRFAVALDDGAEVAGRRLVLTPGVRDQLPPLPGLQERWGQTVLHCPYCHGYEVSDRPLGVIASHPRSDHQAMLLPDWGPTTFFTQGTFEVTDDMAARLAARGVSVEASPITELLGKPPALEAVRLADGGVVRVEALFVAPQTEPASPLASQLGCAMKSCPTGPCIEVGEGQQTSVPGVYAAGDAAAPAHNATLASASGVLAGVGAHQSLAA